MQRRPFTWHVPEEPSTAEQGSRPSSRRFLEFLDRTLVKGSERELQKAKEKLNLLAARYNKTDCAKDKGRKEKFIAEYKQLAIAYGLPFEIAGHSNYSIGRRR